MVSGDFVQVFFVIPLVLMAILFFVFWIIMLIDAATRKFKGESDKVVWVLVIVLVGIVGALIYYFVVYMKDRQKSIRWFWWTLLGLVILFLLILLIMVYSVEART